jgi:hypothetical protein
MYLFIYKKNDQLNNVGTKCYSRSLETALPA